MALVFSADHHAALTTWKNRGVFGDSEYALWQVSQYCIEHGHDWLIGGDTTDQRLGRKEAVRYAQRHIEEVIKAGQRVGFVAGNHDPECWIDTSTQLERLTVHLEHEGMAFGDHVIGGLDFRPRLMFQEALAEIPEEVDILVCHQHFGDIFPLGNPQAVLDDVPEHVRLVLAGDIHQIHNISNARGQRLLSPGCPYIRKVNDPDEHGFWLIEEDLSQQYVEIHSRPVIRVDMEALDDLEELRVLIDKESERAGKVLFADGVPPQFRSIVDPLVFMRYFADELPTLPELASQAFPGGAHIFEIPVYRTDMKLLERLRKQQLDGAKVGTMSEFLSAEVSEITEKAAHSTLSAFLGGMPLQDCLLSLAAQQGLSEDEIKTLLPQASVRA